MDRLRAIEVFSRVADAGSFASAARSMDLSTSVVSKLVQELEEHLGARLINRTTRRLVLTDAGEKVLEQARAVLHQWSDLEAIASDTQAEPRGLLRVFVPTGLAKCQIVKHISRFREQYPKVALELYTRAHGDSVLETYDVSVVVTSSKAFDSSFIAIPLARSTMMLCASPSYLDRLGRPKQPKDLANYSLLAQPNVREWSLQCVKDNSSTEFDIGLAHPGFASEQVDMLYSAALHGMGIAGLPSFIVKEAIIQNRLERVLPEWDLPHWSIYCFLPSRRHMASRTRVFVNSLRQFFGDEGVSHDPWLVAME